MDVLCEGGRIVAVAPDIDAEDAEVIEAAGMTVGPGFIDIHVHGGGGHSFFGSSPDAVRAYARWAPRNGVTSFLVSTVGRDDTETEAILKGLAPAIGAGQGAEALGFHLEGPFISPQRKGAFPSGYLREPVVEEFTRYQAAAEGRIRQVTLAPEREGALEMIHAIEASGAVAALGHTDGTFDDVRGGFEAGARHVTHLFNAMRPLHQREGGPIAAALLEGRATCELICDGTHVAPEVLRLAYSALGPERMVVVTDNLQIAGTNVGAGAFGGRPVSVEGNAAVRADGTIVGSVATMDEHFRNVVAYLGVDVGTAFRLCAANAAGIAGAASRKGSIAPGMEADLVVLDGELRVMATICRGEVAYRREGANAPGAVVR